jgi:hypothetical protein
MSLTQTMTCDGCAKPIVGDPSNPRSECLVLYAGSIPTPETGQPVTMVAIAPLLDHEHHFHDLKCLREWMERH